MCVSEAGSGFDGDLERNDVSDCLFLFSLPKNFVCFRNHSIFLIPGATP